MMTPRFLCFLLMSFFMIGCFATGCGSLTQDDYQQYIVIESYAIAGEFYPEIKLSTTVEAMAEYNTDDAALRNAIIQLSELDGDGNAIHTADYLRSEAAPGTYQPATRNARIKEGHTYRFEIEIPEHEGIITAQTTVPEQFSVVNEVPPNIEYQSENQLEIIITKNSSVSNGFYVFSSTALEPAEANLTPFYRAIVENDDEQNAEDFIITDSGLISEANFEVNDDGTITLVYPWLGVAFYGQNQIVTYSVDKNTYDLVRSQSVQLGGSTLSPGEIPNLIYHVEGAIGIFGSMATDTVFTNFTRPN